MSKENTKEFTLPERLITQRNEGQHDGSRPPRKLKRPRRYYVEDEDLQSDIHLPKQSIYGDDVNKIQEPLKNATRNALTMVGILPSQAQLVNKFLEENITKKDKIEYKLILPNVESDIDEDDFLFQNSESTLGNYLYLEFNRDVESIDFIKPIIQIDPNIIVSCFVGYFTKENVYAVPVKQKEEGISLFRTPPLDENLVATELETKSYLTLFREFVLGEQEIPRKRGTIRSLIYSIFDRSY